jgi:cytochrome P450
VCPGATLARLEAVAMLEALASRVAEVTLVADFEPEPNPVFWSNGHRRLRATLLPA